MVLAVVFTSKASLRYFSSSGLRPVLALKTKEGAFLSVEDKITDVLSSNEEVIASVESWDLPVLSERYHDACLNTNTGKLYFKRSLKKAIYLVTLILFSIAFLCILSDVFAVLARLDKSLVHGKLCTCVVFYGVNNLKLFFTS